MEEQKCIVKLALDKEQMLEVINLVKEINNSVQKLNESVQNVDKLTKIVIKE